MFLQPFGATIELPADHEAIDRLGAIAKEATVRATKRNGCTVPFSVTMVRTATQDAVHGRNYRQGPIYTTIYPASGSSVDYVYAVNGVTYSYGTEMRSSNGNGPADPVLPASEEMWA